MASTNTSVINNGNGNNTKRAALRYQDFRGREYNKTINVIYNQRNCYALYGGETEVPVGNTTWSNLVIKGIPQGDFNPSSAAEKPEKRIYVLSGN